jgi:hypothetical protein
MNRIHIYNPSGSMKAEDWMRNQELTGGCTALSLLCILHRMHLLEEEAGRDKEKVILGNKFYVRIRA